MSDVIDGDVSVSIKEDTSESAGTYERTIAACGARQVGQDPATGVEAFAPATGGRLCPATSLKLVTPH